MSKKIQFFKSGIVLTSVGLAMRTVAMLFGAFITRTVGAEGMGLYTVVMTVYSFAITFATSGISLTVTRMVAGAIGEGRAGRVSGILKASVIYAISFGTIATLFLLLGANFLGTWVLSDIRTVRSLRILALSLIPTSLCAVYSGYFVGVKRVGFNAAVQVFSQFVKIVITVILVNHMIDGGIVSAVIALCLGITLTEHVSLLLIFIEFVIDRSLHRKAETEGGVGILRDVCKSTLPLAVSAYFRSILTTAEHILIPRRLLERGENNTEAYSHYGTLHGMALPLVLYPMSPLSSFSGLLVPEFAEDKAAENRRRMERVANEAINTTLIYSVLVAVILYSFSEELGYAVYDSYGAGKFIAMLAPVVPVMYLDHVTDGILKGIGEQVYSMWVNITDALLSVVLVYFLIPAMGIAGYAVVIVIMEGYNFLLSAFRLAGKIRLRPDYVGAILCPAVSAFASATLANEILRFGGRGASPLWIGLKILFCVAAFVFIFLGVRIPLFRMVSFVSKSVKNVRLKKKEKSI